MAPGLGQSEPFAATLPSECGRALPEFHPIFCDAIATLRSTQRNDFERPGPARR